MVSAALSINAVRIPRLRQPRTVGFVITLAAVCMLLPAAGTTAETGDAGSRSDMGRATETFDEFAMPPVLLVNDSVPVEPLADDTSDLVLSLCGDVQHWQLLSESTPLQDINSFGYYTDIGVGLTRTSIFQGADDAGSTRATSLVSIATVGFWLLNDLDSNGFMSGSDVCRYSERQLSTRSTAGSHQCFLVYDVSAYKGTGAVYNLHTSTGDFSYTGDFDLLLCVDDDPTESGPDHNDLVVGVACSSLPVDSICDSIAEVNHFTLVFEGVSYDLDAKTSTWEYTLEWDGTPPELSHFTLELCDEVVSSDLVESLPSGATIGHDGSSGLYGIKWDNFQNFPANTPVPFRFTIKWLLAIGENEFAPKAGINLNLATICGPSLECELISPCEYNNPPIATCPGNDTVFVCELSPICLPGFTGYDPDGNLQSSTVGGGTLHGDTVCFDPAEGDNIITFLTVDSCGETDICQTLIHVVLNRPPEAYCPENDTFLVCDLGEICLDGFGCNDPDGDWVSSLCLGGTFIGGTVCFLPFPGDNVLTYICTDSCGLADTCQTTIHVAVNSPPQAACPPDDSVFVCSLDTIVCVDGLACFDSDDNLLSSSVNGQVFAGGSYCFSPREGQNIVTLICTDSCGRADTCTTNVSVTTNSPPAATCPQDDTMFVCELADICIGGFGCYDPDGNGAATVVLGGTLSADTVCFTPVQGDNLITFICNDSCGAADTCTVNIHVVVNRPPTVWCPANDTVFVCDLSEICVPGFGCTDPDNNVLSATVIGGSLHGDTVCFTPLPGENLIIFVATDSCGASDTCQTVIRVVFNTPPEASCPGGDTFFVCDLDEICIAGFGCYDVDGNQASSEVIEGTVHGDTVCLTPMPGENLITYICTDSCGAADTCLTTIHVILNTPPEASCPPSDTFFVCSLDTSLCIDGFGCSDIDNNSSWSTVNGVSYQGGPFCLWPEEGLNTLTFICADSCGAADTCVTTLYVTVNRPPVAVCPDNDTLFVCDLNSICITGFSWQDPDGNFASSHVLGGILSGDTVCFTPVAGDNTITLIGTDSCGAADTCRTTIHVTLNSAPTAACPAPDTVFVCDLSEICLDGFTCTDVDDNYLSSTVVGGTLQGDLVCLTPGAGDNIIMFVCVDACGAADTCETALHVVLNGPPEAHCPSAETLFVCSLDTTICVDGFSCLDPDDNLAGSSINGLSFEGGAFCFAPTAGSNLLRLTCEDSCGLADTCEMAAYVTVNRPPVPQCPADTVLYYCDQLEVMCLDGFTAFDPDGNLSSCTIDQEPCAFAEPFCFLPDSGRNLLILTCIDSCQASAQCTAYVDVVDTCYVCPSVTIEKTHRSIQGQHEFVDVTLDSGSFLFGGFDIVISYDRSAVNFQSVVAGELHTECDWEYLTYRTWFDPSYDPHFFWGGIVRVVALADMNDGANHPDCFLRPTPFVLFTLDFLVTDNRQYECQFAPVSFFWTDCGDNTFSSVGGDTLFVSRHVFGYDLVGEITDPNTGFPTYTGIQLECLSGGGPGKPSPLRCLNFYNGGVDIACAEELDDRGDINLNGIPYEIADAVLFSSYFIFGQSIFRINSAGQIAATDVNADGLTLTVGDLVYLVRVIVGDAMPYPKLTPVEATYTITNGVISVDGEMGAAFVVLEGKLNPTLLAEHMEMRFHYSADENVTRVLIYSLEGNGFSGEFLQVTGKVVSLEFGSYDGAVVKASEIPASFALHQNYPNPFNPTTEISFSLPEASTVKLDIFNLLGQHVITLVDNAREAGTHSVVWNGTDSFGRHVSSGVYFYRFQAGDFVKAKKMMMLK